MIEFTVIDNKTGAYPDCEKIALTEEWAKHLCYCDIDCFAITEDGALILIDDCGRMAYCPAGRFAPTIDPEELRPKGRWIEFDGEVFDCSVCHEIHVAYPYNYCPNCGAKMEVT